MSRRHWCDASVRPQLAHKYCSDCRRDFDDLSKVIQKVLASRRELLRYDRQARDGPSGAAAAASAPVFCQVSVSVGAAISCCRPAGTEYSSRLVSAAGNGSRG